MALKGDALHARRLAELEDLGRASAAAAAADAAAAASDDTDDPGPASAAFSALARVDEFPETENLQDEWHDAAEVERWYEKVGLTGVELRFNRRRMYLDDAYRHREPKVRSSVALLCTANNPTCSRIAFYMQRVSPSCLRRCAAIALLRPLQRCSATGLATRSCR